MINFASIGIALLFFVAIMASVALHEVGHMVPAKLFGVKVTQYFVGFGKTLWSRKRGETEYGFKAFPLGGYVRLVGMYPPQRDTGRKKGWLTRLADQARSYEYEEITPADDGRLFHQKPVWQKVIVMLGGPAMNLVLAFLIFLGINTFFGTMQANLQVSVVNECVIPSDRKPAVCQPGDPETPAKQAGIQVGDKLVAFNGQHAGRQRRFFDEQGYATVVLPSTSPAYASLNLDQKSERWLSALGPFLSP